MPGLKQEKAAAVVRGLARGLVPSSEYRAGLIDGFAEAERLILEGGEPIDTGFRAGMNQAVYVSDFGDRQRGRADAFRKSFGALIGRRMER
jgi:hypothetical protein